MSQKLTEAFHFIDWSEIEKQSSAEEKYKQITQWALKARQSNPDAFDNLIGWILDDSEWTKDQLAKNEEILMNGVILRFREQNTKMRTYLRELESSGVVNTPVFNALDQFDKALSGSIEHEVHDITQKVLNDFSLMTDRSIREIIAGKNTDGDDSFKDFGWLNFLSISDSQVLWCLFMPDYAAQQQKGFKVESFEYKTLPVMLFIGKDDDDLENIEVRKALFKKLDTMTKYKSGFDHDVLFIHHYGKGVDVGPAYRFYGRFMKADTPVPEGFVSFDFMPHWVGEEGFPFLSEFAFAVFSGDTEAMHKTEGFDVNAMYDVTRNIILGQGINIPYPEKYWVAEVFLNGHEKPSSAYMFSVELKPNWFTE